MGIQNRDFMDIGEEYFLPKVDFCRLFVLLGEARKIFFEIDSKRGANTPLKIHICEGSRIKSVNKM